MDFEKISDAEMEVMNIIWNSVNPVATAQIFENLPQDKKWSQSTVLTFLARLVQKKILSCTKKGKSNVYNALISKEQYLQSETRKFVSTLHAGSMKSYISTLLDCDNISAEELEEIKKWFLER